MRRTKEEGGTEGGKQVAAAAAAQNPNGGDLLSHLKSTLRAPLNTAAAIVAMKEGEEGTRQAQCEIRDPPPIVSGCARSRAFIGKLGV